MSGPRVSPPFADRELDGKLLLEEIAALRAAGVSPSRLMEADRAISTLGSLEAMDVQDAAEALRAVAMTELEDVPVLAQVITRWAARLRLEGDVPLLRRHLRKLAVTSAMIGAVWKAAAAQRAPRRGGA